MQDGASTPGLGTPRSSAAEGMPGEGRSSGCSPVWLQARLPPLYPKESAALQLLAASGDSLFAGADFIREGMLRHELYGTA